MVCESSPGNGKRKGGQQHVLSPHTSTHLLPLQPGLPWHPGEPLGPHGTL